MTNQEAIEDIRNNIKPIVGGKSLDMAIEALEERKTGRWIPCSERLPDQNGKYLVVGRQKAINILKFDGGRWYGKWGVVAWMPLPSPYREETES